MVRSGYSSLIRFIQLFSDLVLLNLWIVIAGLIKFSDDLSMEFSQEYYKTLFIVLNLTWIVVTSIFKTYDIQRTTNWVRIIRKTSNAIIVHFLFISAFIVLLKGYNFSRLFISYLYIGFGASALIWNSVFSVILKWYRKQGFNYRIVALVGDSERLQSFYKQIICNQELGYKFAGYFGDVDLPELEKKGAVNDFSQFARNNRIDEVFCSFSKNDDQAKEVAKFCDNNFIRFRYIPNLDHFGARRFSVNFIENFPVLIEHPEPLKLITNRILKRAFDVIFSLLVFVFVIPWLFPLIALAIKINSSGPIFFVQLRSGLENKVIKCIKFRTMYFDKSSQENRKVQASENDPRVTRVGAFLRKTNLDEFPQFINVLRGEMSVCGPRPHMLAHTREYSRIIDKYMVRHFIKPGITGLAQVNGYRGETKTNEEMEKRVEYDVLYLENWSLLLDVKIIVKTIFNMVSGEKKAY